jgi:hypothetical protein
MPLVHPNELFTDYTHSNQVPSLEQIAPRPTGKAGDTILDLTAVLGAAPGD